MLLQVILNQVYLVTSMIDLTLSTSFLLLFFSPIFGVGASNMQCTPLNNVVYDTAFNGCENNVVYILITVVLFIDCGYV